MNGWESAYQSLNKCFQSIGIEAEEVALDDVPGLTEEPLSIEKFSRWVSRHGFPEEPSMLSLLVGYNFPLSLLTTSKSKAYASMVGASSPTGGKLYIEFDPYFGEMSNDSIRTVGVEAWRSGGFRYGYALTHRDAISFVVGGMSVKLSAPENLRRKNWQNFLFQAKDGVVDLGEYLRDVFPINYLVATHLKLDVGGLSLEAWITTSSGRGKLIAVADGLWIWEVANREDRGRIRSALDSAGLLVSPGGWGD